MAAQGPPVIRAVQATLRFPRREGPLEDYRNPARQPVAFFHASTCQGTVADLDAWIRGWVEMAKNRRDWKLRERVWALRVVGMVSATP